MAVFDDKKIGLGGAVLLLFLLFLLIYPAWHLADREMLGMEGELAVAVSEMQGFDSAPTTHGYLFADAPPLFLLIAKLVSLLGVPAAWILRGLSLLSYFILTGLTFLICRRNCGLQAACAATAVMLSTAIVFDKLPYGSPVALTALLLYGGWIVWIEWTLRRSNWNLAWLFAGLFGALIYWNAGVTGLIYFFVPLFLQRRPLTVWPRLQYAGLYCGGLILAGAVALLWCLQHGVAPEPGGTELIPFSIGGYITNVLVFPFYAFTRLLPWSFFRWAPFCAALIPLQLNPLFGKFHRILFLSLFVLIWFNPATASRDLFYLMPLIATMVGSYYWIIARRYGYRFNRFAAFCGWGFLILALLTGIYLFLPGDILNTVCRYLSIPSGYLAANRQELPLLIIAGTEAGAAFLFALLILCFKCRFPCWLTLCFLFTAGALLAYAFQMPYWIAQREKQHFALEIRDTMSRENFDPAAGIIHTNISGLFAESYYTGYRFRYVDMGELPAELPTVYLLTVKAPEDPNRSWSLLWKTEYRGQRIFINKGQLIRSYEDDQYLEDI
ncbi:MAG: hypothetical protein J6Q65_01445 [Lentisphaeria bacterium]|nr:hypothetical protein [Lentisphaeria bacterium]